MCMHAQVVVLYIYIYNLFRVRLFHSDETFHVYACTSSGFFFK